MAHIYSFSPDGPRGQGPFTTSSIGLNDLPNLILVCLLCHNKIDQDKEGTRYTPALLKQWKQEHEDRVRRVTDGSGQKRSHVVLYGAKIGETGSPLVVDSAIEAMWPDRYPADDRSVNLSMFSSHEDSESSYWNTEAKHLRKEFARLIQARVEEANPNHFSVFALAPQPLLILLGSLFSETIPAETYQLHREPRTWNWLSDPDDMELIVNEPLDKTGTPVLIISLSGKIAHERITTVLGEGIKAAVWEITIANPNNDFLRSKEQLKNFRQAVRKVFVAVKHAFPIGKELLVFPTMPVACAFEFGRLRMPKADVPVVIYDENDKHKKFIPTLTIGDNT